MEARAGALSTSESDTGTVLQLRLPYLLSTTTAILPALGGLTALSPLVTIAQHTLLFAFATAVPSLYLKTWYSSTRPRGTTAV